MKITEDNLFPALVAGTLAVSAAVSAATAFLISGRFALSVLAGGVLATANLCWLRGGLAAILQNPGEGAHRAGVIRFLLRMGVVGLFLYLLIVKLKAHVIGLLLGLSILVALLVILTLISTRKGG